MLLDKVEIHDLEMEYLRVKSENLEPLRQWQQSGEKTKDVFNTSEPSLPPKLGDRIRLHDGRTGKVEYIGAVDIWNGSDVDYIGLDLDEWDPNGHDGSIGDDQYFSANHGHGYFVTWKDIAENLTINRFFTEYVYTCGDEKEYRFAEKSDWKIPCPVDSPYPIRVSAKPVDGAFDFICIRSLVPNKIVIQEDVPLEISDSFDIPLASRQKASSGSYVVECSAGIIIRESVSIEGAKAISNSKGGQMKFITKGAFANEGELSCDGMGEGDGGVIYIDADSFVNDGKMQSVPNGQIEIKCSSFINNGVMNGKVDIEMFIKNHFDGVSQSFGPVKDGEDAQESEIEHGKDDEINNFPYDLLTSDNVLEQGITWKMLEYLCQGTRTHELMSVLSRMDPSVIIYRDKLKDIDHNTAIPDTLPLFSEEESEIEATRLSWNLVRLLSTDNGDGNGSEAVSSYLLRQLQEILLHSLAVFHTAKSKGNVYHGRVLLEILMSTWPKSLMFALSKQPAQNENNVLCHNTQILLKNALFRNLHQGNLNSFFLDLICYKHAEKYKLILPWKKRIIKLFKDWNFMEYLLETASSPKVWFFSSLHYWFLLARVSNAWS